MAARAENIIKSYLKEALQAFNRYYLGEIQVIYASGC